MKKLVLVILALVFLILGFAALSSAQVANITVKVQWNPNPVSDSVTSYTLTIDGGAPITVLPASCTALVCEQAATLSFASHTFVLSATNQWGTSPSSTTTANLSIPGAPANLRIVR